MTAQIVVLVVDDDDAIREAIEEVLADEGYIVRTAANGDEALKELRSKPTPDLVFLDLMMPIKDGFQFRQEQMLDSELSKIPVVVMTADPNVAENKQRLQTAHFLKKPLDVDAILSTAGRLSAKAG